MSTSNFNSLENFISNKSKFLRTSIFHLKILKQQIIDFVLLVEEEEEKERR
jgi:hypothetical protein